MASDGRRQRIAIYWIEPAMFREAPFFLRCCDLIFDRDIVHYWIHGMPQPGVFHLSRSPENSLLPVQKSPESILRSALAIVSQIRYSHDQADTALEVAAFFEGSRGRTEYTHEVLPREASPPPSSNGNVSDVQLLNTLPFGREYSKQTRADGSVVWRARKASNGPPIATVTIQRIGEPGRDGSRAAFDEQTLGQWTLIAEAYRTYWSFDRALAEVSVASEPRPRAGAFMAS